MKKYADLEISLHRREADCFGVDFRFSQPDSEADVRLGQGIACFDLQKLSAIPAGMPDYGQTLTSSLFADEDVKTAFAQALASTQSLELPLRLRLYIGPSAPELHSLHWETICNPQDGAPISTSENILFSRYLSSLDWRPVRLKPKGELKALVLVANPSNLSEYDLEPIDVEQEQERAREGLKLTSITAIPDVETGRPATLETLFAQLRGSGYTGEDSYDVLYIACHGSLAQGEPWLWLDDEQGQAKRVSGHELVMRFRELEELPRLVILASCQSAGDGNGQALSALGPRLAQAGIPAVLAMQGKVSLDTIGQFMPVFFETLQQEGQVDHAVNVARGVVRDRADHWMPALFMRLRSGRIWYTPGFGGEQPEFEKWESITTAIEESTCTAILGPSLTEPLLGNRREIALRWAEKHGYPLSPYDQEDLPRVAQYVVTRQDPSYLRTAYREAIRDEILRRHGNRLSDELRSRQRWSAQDVLTAIEEIADVYWENKKIDPFEQLARLRLPIYITASPHDLLKRALIAEGVQPEVRLCPWNDLIPKSKCIYTDDPTPEKPLIYHLFGHITDPFSLVITEDEFFDYLIGITINKELIPEAVRAALTSTALLFLGFRMDDWNFRVLFRMIMAQGGREMLKLFSHAAAQIEPEEGRIIDAQRARRYLEKYFISENISMFWGSSEDFLEALRQNLGTG